jgi:periplasmic protein TonB
VFPRTDPETRAIDFPRVVTAPPKPAEPTTKRGAPWRGLAASLLLHAMLIAALLGLLRPPAPVEPPAPAPITVVLAEPGAAGAAGGGTVGAPASGTAGATRLSSQAAPEAAPAANAATARATPMTLPDAAPPPVPTPPAPTAPPQHKAAALPPLPAQKPRPPLHVEHRRETARTTPHTLPKLAAAPPPPASMPATPAPAPAAQQRVASATAPGPGGGAGSGAGPGHAAAGNGPGIAGAGGGAADDWLDRARQRLRAFMKDPNDNRGQKKFGTVWVTITVAHDGTVLDAELEKSSGVGYLDRAALQMVHDASPLPPLPASIKAASARFSVPADYEPGFFERLFGAH